MAKEKINTPEKDGEFEVALRPRLLSEFVGQKKLKEKLACGGTYKPKEKTIELQGDHRRKVKELLVQLGFESESIEVLQ